jgi:hypothetical protein
VTAPVTRSALVVVLACAGGGALLPSAARAEAPTGEVRSGVKVFVEPAPSQSVAVVTPSVRGRVDVRPWLSLAVDWESDVVTGATPRTYGADVVSGATRFVELRNSVGASAEVRRGPVTAAAGYRFGIEKDYRSHVVRGDLKLDLLQHDTVLAASYAHNFDSVCDLDNRGLAPTLRQPLSSSNGCFTDRPGLTVEPLAVDAIELALVQTLTRRLMAQLVGSFEHLDGFQSNPYRRVRLYGGVVEAQEAHPRLRDRGSLTLRARGAVPGVRGAVGVDLRLYDDTWDLRSLALEASWDQLHLNGRLRWRALARYYHQGRASFYRDAGQANSYERAGPAGEYFTGDRELAPFADLLLGGRVSYLGPARPAGRRYARLFRGFELTARLDLMKVFAVTPEPPNAARMRGVVDAVSAGLSFLGEL